MKILIVRPDKLGDLALSLPAAAAVKERFPNSEVTLFVANEVMDFARLFCAHFDHILGGGIEEYRNLLKSKKIDLAIHLADYFDYAWESYRAGIKKRIGDRGKLLYFWIFNLGTRLQLDLKPETQLNLELLAPLGITSSVENLKIEFPAETIKISGKNWIGIHPGTGGTNKPWLPERYAELINSLPDKNFILLGGKREAPLSKFIEERSKVLNLTGKTTLPELTYLISKLRIYIGVDSGPLHIASLLKVPTVFISPTKSIRPERWRPRHDRYVVIRHAEICPDKKCSAGACPKNTCVEAITVSEVRSALMSML